MSKLSFRARALDPSKPMPIFLAEELPDLPEYSAINRAVPQMPSGMEKEEESEHHLQRAICTGLIIPTPEVFTIEQDFFDRNYPPDYKMPRQLIHMQPLGLEQDIPDYDIDSSDEVWVNQQSRRLDLTVLKFEQMMDRLEKSSGQTVITLNEAKALLKQDDEISIAVYDYWLNKRLKTQHPLILSVKTENRPGASANNPYLAFRRRTEKMQTRKNRKNDETSYEKMLKLKRDLYRAVTLLDMVKRREKTKREQLHLSIEIFEKRYQAKDFSGSILAELSSTLKSSRPAFAPLYTNQYSHHSSVLSAAQSGVHLPSSATSSSGHHYSTSQYLNSSSHGVVGRSTGRANNSHNSFKRTNKRDVLDSINANSNSSSSRKEKRQYKKRKHKLSRDKQYSAVQSASPAAIESPLETEEEDLIGGGGNGGVGGSHLGGRSGDGGSGGVTGGGASDTEDDGLYAFKRNKSCEYHKPLTTQSGNWLWESKDDNGFGDTRFRYTLASIRHPRPMCIGFARRRMGRGGRMILDRARTTMDAVWSQLDYTIFDNKYSKESSSPSSSSTATAELAIKIEKDNDIVRDPMYISTSSDVISCPFKIEPNFQQQQQHHPNSNSIANPDENNSISNISNHLLSKEIKHEILSDTEENEWTTPTTQNQNIVVDLVRTHCNSNSGSSSNSSSNNNNNLLNSNTINLNINNNNRTNDKFMNVIKQETIVKQEEEEAADLNILDDENVNLACLSNFINANKSPKQAATQRFSIAANSFRNNLVNFIRNNNNKRSRRSSSNDNIDDNDDDGDNNCDTSNYNYDEFVDEIRKDWLHFRPKTPPPDSPSSPSAAKVEFSEQTPICIEMQRLGATTPPSSVFTPSAMDCCDSLFVTNPFCYSDLQPDEQLLFNPTAQNQSNLNLLQPDISSNSGIDFNLSGDSLNELNLSLGESEDNEKMLDNILQECQIDDLKTLNQTTNFWSGLLDDGNGNGLLDCIDEKKPIVSSSGEVCKDIMEKDCKKSGKRKAIARCRMGSSQFTVESAVKEEGFFKKEEIREDIKIEPPDEIMASPPPPLPPQQQPQATIEPRPPPSLPLQQQPPPPAVILQQRQQILQAHSQLSQPNRLPQQTLVPINHQQSKHIVTTTPVTQILHAQQQQLPIGAAATQSTILASLGQGGLITTSGGGPQKIYIKQEPTNQVPSNLNPNAVITLANVKLENDMSGTTLLAADGTNSVGQQTPMIVTTPKQHPQQFLLQQIGQNATQIINVSNSTGGLTTDVSGTFVLAGNNVPVKRHLNGPVDRNVALQNLVSRRFINRKIHSIPQSMQSVQQQQIHVVKQEDNNRSGSPKPNQSTGGFIKMSSYPVVVSELNAQQHQNSLSAAVVANHNYSLPSSQPITIINQGQPHQGGNKIILSSSSAAGSVTGSGNFTITTPIQDMQTNKIHYKEIPTSNLKLNFVTTSTGGGGNSQQIQQQTPQGIATQQQQQQQQRIKLDKSFNMLIDTQDQKRVVYTKLVNVSTLQHKNNSGQTVQVAPGSIQNVNLNKAHTIQRLGTAQAIFTNMRSIPMGAVGSSAGAGGGGLINNSTATTDVSSSSGIGGKPTNNANSNELNTTNR